MRVFIFACILFSVPQLFARSGDCASDRSTFCKGIEPGEGRINTCLFARWSEVSPQCKEKKKDAYARWSARQEACGTDLEKFCKTVQTGEGRGGQCLRKKMKELNPSCQAFLENRKKDHKARLAACASDIETHCPDLKNQKGKQKGATWKCLVAHQDELSETCQQQWPSLAKRAERMKRKAARATRKAANKGNKGKKK